MSLKLKCHSKWKTTQFKMSLKLNVIKIKCHSICNVTQIEMPLKHDFFQKGLI